MEGFGIGSAGFGAVREIEFAENERRDVLLIERGTTRFEVEEQILEELDGDVLCRALFGIETLFAGRFIVGFLLEAVGETALEFFELEDRQRGSRSYGSRLETSQKRTHGSKAFPAIVTIAGSA